MISFSTSEVPPDERFDHWREVRGKQLFGVTIELERERRADFAGRFSAVAVGGATLATMQASAYQVSRTAADISRMPGDSLVIFEQVVGPGWCEPERGDLFHVVDGALIAGHSDFAFACTPATAAHFRFRALTIPLTAETAFANSARSLAIAPLDYGRERYSRLLAASFASLFDEATELAEPEAANAIQDLAQLLLLSRALATPGSARSRGALRSAHVQAARRVMKRNLHHMGLSADSVAAMLAISVRQLHLLFEPSGKSFMRTLATMRIEEACRLLREAPEQQVADIGFACGFHSLATFYRAFREIRGLAPNDYRRMMQEWPDR
ncbi:MAG: helix-turn-helix domain-containing protein [Phreatobacter sp.]